MDVDDVRRLGEAAPFAWSAYTFKRDGDLYDYRNRSDRQPQDVGNVGWNGREIVAFRLHMPSKIEYHNTRESAAATSSSGSSRWPSAFAEHRFSSMCASRHNRFCIARCGSLAGRSSRLRSHSVS